VSQNAALGGAKCVNRLVNHFNSARFLQRLATAIFSWKGERSERENSRDNKLAIAKSEAYYVVVHAGKDVVGPAACDRHGPIFSALTSLKPEQWG
jgi:hypothetical protein